MPPCPARRAKAGAMVQLRHSPVGRSDRGISDYSDAGGRSAGVDRGLHNDLRRMQRGGGASAEFGYRASKWQACEAHTPGHPEPLSEADRNSGRVGSIRENRTAATITIAATPHTGT